MMMRALLLLLLGLGLAELALPPPAVAQNDIMRVIRRDYETRQRSLIPFFGSGETGRRVEPLQAPRPRKVRQRVSPFAAPKPVIEAETPVVPPSLFVQVLGDSLAELLTEGLKTQLKDRPDVAVASLTKSSSGFVRTDFFDWSRAASDLLAAGSKIDAAVIMIGATDRQAIHGETGDLELRSDAWRAAYVARIDAILAQLKARSIKI